MCQNLKAFAKQLEPIWTHELRPAMDQIGQMLEHSPDICEARRLELSLRFNEVIEHFNQLYLAVQSDAQRLPEGVTEVPGLGYILDMSKPESLDQFFKQIFGIPPRGEADDDRR